jgi:hypothetical protein
MRLHQPGLWHARDVRGVDCPGVRKQNRVSTSSATLHRARCVRCRKAPASWAHRGRALLGDNEIHSPRSARGRGPLVDTPRRSAHDRGTNALKGARPETTDETPPGRDVVRILFELARYLPVLIDLPCAFNPFWGHIVEVFWSVHYVNPSAGVLCGFSDGFGWNPPLSS